jgi:hypothetical protein
MQAYEACTRPLTEYYRRAGKLVPVRAHGTPGEVLARSLLSLNEKMVGEPT